MTQKGKLPLRIPGKPAEQQGIFHKFDVRRTDGSSRIGGKHHGCEYFVLDVAHDPHARTALAAYAASCASTHPELSKDMAVRYNLEAEPMALPKLPNTFLPDFFLNGEYIKSYSQSQTVEYGNTAYRKGFRDATILAKGQA